MLTDEEKKLVGGSDVSAVAGLNPYKGPIDVFRRIVEGYEAPAGPAARRGERMEPVIRLMAAEDLGLNLLGPRKLRDPKRDYMRASLDDVHQDADSEEVVEFKSVASYAAQEYGDGEDAFPQHHHCQLQTYLAISGLPRGHLVALLGLDDLRHYTVKSDPEIQGMLFETVERFYMDHILTRKPPPEDASQGCADWLASRFPADKAPAVSATPEAERWAKQLQSARMTREAAEHMEEEAKNHLKAICGSAAGIVGAGWRLSWQLSKGRVSTDFEAIAREMNAPPSLIAKHTKERPGSRSFRPTFQSGAAK